jgi:hypothetical protein
LYCFVGGHKARRETGKMDYRDLEDEIVDAIQRCCITDEDKEKAKEYFADTLVSKMIDEALED